MFFADCFYLIALFWVSIYSKESTEVTSACEFITVTILFHCSFFCIYLCACLHVIVSTTSADKILLVFTIAFLFEKSTIFQILSENVPVSHSSEVLNKG